MIRAMLQVLIVFAAAAGLSAQTKNYTVETGTHVPLSLINSVSTKNAVPGDRVYLESVFPILVDGRIVIPPGSYVMGTITEIRRPGQGERARGISSALRFADASERHHARFPGPRDRPRRPRQRGTGSQRRHHPQRRQ